MPDNERTFALRPGQGIFIYGEVRELSTIGVAKCVGGTHDGEDCSDNDAPCWSGEEPGRCQPVSEPAAMVTYFKSLSFESVMEGSTLDFGTMTGSGTDTNFGVTIVVHIIVE